MSAYPPILRKNLDQTRCCAPQTYALANGESITIRCLITSEDADQCVLLQDQTWGKNAGTIPASMIKVGMMIGGLAAGAFDKEGRLIGFILSWPGESQTERFHWSFRLAVLPEYRDHRIGQLLKQYQKTVCLQMGIESIYWSYDPLESRNAYFNLVKLGCQITGFQEDMYEHSESSLHRGTPTDRLIVRWDLRRPAQYPTTTQDYRRWPVIQAQDPLPKPGFRMAIPADIQTLKLQNLPQAQAYADVIRHVGSQAFETHAIVHYYLDAAAQTGYYVFEEKPV